MASPQKYSRRTLLKGVAGSALVTTSGIARAQAPAKPNIVFIMADDMGYADVSCYGRPDIQTPNIDSIAARGTRFLQGYANSAVCSATRTALITGRYQYRLPIGLEEPLGVSRPEIGLPPEHPTLPSLLKKVGYGTTLIGKWHLGALPKFGPLKSGYDHFYGFRGGAIDYFDHQGDFWNNDEAFHPVGYSTELFGQHAVDVVSAYARNHQPFFLSLHFNAPHWPWESVSDEAESERLRTRSIQDYDGGSQRTYQRMIQTMDIQIGRVLQALAAGGLTENTIVVFTSDNGGERFADTWPFTGRKTELLEGGLRIPTIIAWPGRIPEDRTSEQVAISMDWLPTLLTAAGTQPDAAFPPDGINLLPFLVEGRAPNPRKLFWRYKANAQAAMRDGDFKYLKIRDNTFLFNVAEDPMERANLKERRKDIYDRLVTEWNEWNASVLPIDPKSGTNFFKANELADHIGAQ
jgi:arylsulfatase A-like enzyme